MRGAIRLFALGAVLAAATAGLAGASSSAPDGVKAWMGPWKARWGTVIFDTTWYRAPHSSQDFTWGTQGTWVYHGLHAFFGGVGPRNGDYANQTFSGSWFIENGTTSTRGSMLIYRGKFDKATKFTGGYWKKCDYYCTSHHPWKGTKAATNCTKGGCASRKFRYSFSELGPPDHAPQYMKYSKTTLSGTVRVYRNPQIPAGGTTFLGVQGKATGRGQHVHTEDLGTPTIRKVRYSYAAKDGAAYEQLRNGAQILYVPFTVKGINKYAYPDCKKAAGVLILTDSKTNSKDRANWYPSCGTGDLYRFRPAKSPYYLKVKISRTG